jgi:hypothetical protein
LFESTARETGPSMSIRNMRENGVRSLLICCELCHDEAVDERRCVRLRHAGPVHLRPHPGQRDPLAVLT